MSSNASLVTRAAVIATLGLFSPSVFAYLDPSTGSMILSAIVGIFATVGLALKTYWYRLKSFFVGKRGDEESLAEQEVEQQEGSQP